MDLGRENETGYTTASDLEIEWFREDLIVWFAQNGRKFPWRESGTSLYEHVIAEVLLQRTKAESLADFYVEFLERYGSWSNLAAESVDELKSFLYPLGLSNQRAARLHALAHVMVKTGGEFPESYESLTSLPAVGQYVANAIQLFKNERRAPLLDAGMARVLERVFGARRLADIRYDPFLQETAYRVVDCDDALLMNWAILDLSALICRPRKPKCASCPVSGVCKFARSS